MSLYSNMGSNMDNFDRLNVLEAHNSLFNYDTICLCETNLNDKSLKWI